jgi:hypothetical protein
MKKGIMAQGVYGKKIKMQNAKVKTTARLQDRRIARL